jgi:hypothetical protein
MLLFPKVLQKEKKRPPLSLCFHTDFQNHNHDSGTTTLDIGYHSQKEFLDDKYVNDTTLMFYSVTSNERSWNDSLIEVCFHTFGMVIVMF